ncbi:MAG TPA: glycoside hydrolase family 76 protein [Acidimicrobiales bacterium]|nr:glycoside hydrolase family 76 protein [Acidimicrobiales bacterium]
MTRRWRAALVVVSALLIVAGVLSVPAVPGHAQAALAVDLLASDVSLGAVRADPFTADPTPGSCAGLDAGFGVGNHLFKNSGFGLYASVWPTYAALGLLYVRSLPPGEDGCAADFSATVGSVDANYWDRAAFDQGPRPYHVPSDLPRVDDSLWMGLAMMAADHRAPSPALLHRAEAVFTLAVANWDRDGGGVYWEESGAGGKVRAVVSNAPAVLLGVELYRRTGRARYLRWSERDMAWLRRTLEDPADGLYDDHVAGPGGRQTVDRARYTYVEGVTVAALAALSAVDPSAYPLRAAVALADRSMAYFAAHHAYGQPGFDVVWAQSVLGLAARYGHPGFTARAVRSVRSAVAAGPAHPADLLDTAAEATLHALLRLPPADYGNLWYTAPVSYHVGMPRRHS